MKKFCFSLSRLNKQKERGGREEEKKTIGHCLIVSLSLSTNVCAKDRCLFYTVRSHSYIHARGLYYSIEVTSGSIFVFDDYSWENWISLYFYFISGFTYVLFDLIWYEVCTVWTFVLIEWIYRYFPMLEKWKENLLASKSMCNISFLSIHLKDRHFDNNKWQWWNLAKKRDTFTD